MSVYPAPVLGATITLWPEGVPALRIDAAEEVIAAGRIAHVHYPRLDVYLPSQAGSVGTAVIICPGGGYRTLSMESEGRQVAEFFNRQGIAAFVLHYRLNDYGHPAPLQDVLRAMRVVRSRAAEFGVDPDRIGILGASASGHLAACAATLYDSPEGKTGAALDRINARPNFAILLYPVITMLEPAVHVGSRTNLLGPAPTPALKNALSVERHVTVRNPPAFIVSTQEDDVVPVENSLLFYQALRDKGVSAEIHLWPKGPHGFALRPDLGGVSLWPNLLIDWLKANGWLPP